VSDYIKKKLEFLDVSGNTNSISKKSKKALPNEQDPFTRTLYENEKITFLIINTAKVTLTYQGMKIML